MISANSLSAFSGATASAPLNRSPSAGGVGGVQPARLLRGEDRPGAQAPAPAGPMSAPPPKGPLPRGSLLNLAV